MDSKFIRNKKLYSVLIGLLAITLITAGTLYYSVTRDVHVDKSFAFTGDNSASASVSGGEGVVSDDLLIESQTSVNVPIEIITTETPSDSEITHTIQYLLDNLAGTCLPYPSPTCEKRITILASDTDVDTLSDLSSMSWDANVGSGYLPHVDVYLDLNNDGEYDSSVDDVLVFEYAKVDNTNCDNSPYPTGELDTFADKGTISDTSFAWLNSGDAGACGSPTYYAHSLGDWKSGQTENGKTINGASKVLRFEVEVDNWVSPSDSSIKNILINGNEPKVTLQPEDELAFNVLTDFSIALADWDGTITTEVTANKNR